MTQPTTQATTPAELLPIGDTGLEVPQHQDVRGDRVYSSAGDEVGSVDELLVDPQRKEVRFLRLKGGGILGIGERHWLVPVEAVSRVDEDAVHLRQDRAKLEGAPAYQPDLLHRPHYEDVYGYWGYAPYWGGSYRYPDKWWGTR